MRVRVSRTVNQILKIRILEYNRLRGINRVRHTLPPLVQLVFIGFRQVLRRVSRVIRQIVSRTETESRIKTVQSTGVVAGSVLHTFPVHLDILPPGSQIIFFPGFGNCQPERIISLYLARLSAFRGDDHHTVGSSCPIDSGGSGILQYLKRLDIITVQVGKIGTNDPVHDINRCRPVHVIDRSTTPDNHPRRRAGLPGRTLHLYPGNVALQCRSEIGIRHVLQSRRGQFSDSGGYFFPCLCPEPDDHDFVHPYPGRTQRHVHRLLGRGQFYCPCFISQETEFKQTILLHQIQGVLPFVIRGGTSCSSFNQNEHSCHGFPVLVKNPSFYGTLRFLGLIVLGT